MTVSHLRSSKLQAPMHWRLSMMFCKVYGAKRPCKDFCNALITTLYKNNGSKSNCGNYRGISLLSIAGTIFTRILPNRLIMETDRGLPEAQCGFRPGCSTLDMILSSDRCRRSALNRARPSSLSL